MSKSLLTKITRIFKISKCHGRIQKYVVKLMLKLEVLKLEIRVCIN